MDANSDLKLKGYRVKKIHFELNENFNFASIKEVKINPKFNREFIKIDENNYLTELSVLIADKCQTDIIPFESEVTISAHFEFSNWESGKNNDIAMINSTAILFPYLRSLLSNVTTQGNVPPYILPIINVDKLFPKK